MKTKTPEEIICQVLGLKGTVEERHMNMTMKIREVIECIKYVQMQVNGELTSQDEALHKHVVSITLPQLKRKLLSMRFTKKQMKECDQQGTFIAYGWTDCLNKLLEWTKAKGN